MARYVSGTSGNFSASGTWDTVTNTPTIHATTNIAVTTGGILSATFTAPNTINACTGVMVYCAVAPTLARDFTITLQESTVDKVSVTASNANIIGASWLYFKFASPYTFTTTGAGAYRFKIVSTTSSTGSLGADSGAANFMYLATDDRHVVPAVGTDDIWVAGQNGTGVTNTVTVDGTSQSVGVGTSTTVNDARSIGNAVNIGQGGLLKWDVAANSTLTVRGNVAVYPNGEIRMGTVASPVPAGITAKLIMDENGTTANYGIFTPSSTGGTMTFQGNPLTYWKTKYASGTGTVADPLIMADPVDWSVGDEIIVGATSTNATNYNETENLTIVTKNSTTSYVVTGSNLLVNGDFETSGGGGADVFGTWNETASTGAIAKEAVITHGGTGAAKLTTASGALTLIAQTFTVVPNQQYSLTFWARNATGGATENPRYSIVDATNAANIVGATNTGATTTSYAQITVPFKAPSNCNSVTLNFQCSSATAGHIVYFDDAQIIPQMNYTHTTDAIILNVTRNVLITTQNINQAFYLNNSTAAVSPTFNSKWVRYETTGNLAGSKEGIRFYFTTNATGNMDYSVAYRPIYRGFYFATSHAVNTHTGLIACNQVAATNVGAITLLNVGGKTLNDCYGMSNNRMSFEFNTGGGVTFNRCFAISNDTLASGSAGFNFISANNITLNNCEAHCCRTSGIRANGDAALITVNNSLFGTKGQNNTTDVNMGTDNFFTVLFNNCLFGSATLITNYLISAKGSQIAFHKLNQTDNNHRWYTNYGSAYSTGAALSDTTVYTAGSLGLKIAPEEATTGFSWQFLIPAPASSIIPFFCYAQKNAAMGTDVAKFEMFLPGNDPVSGTADATYTMTTSGAWEAVSMSASYVGTVSDFATIKVTGLTTTASAYLYVDTLYNADTTQKLTGLDAWYHGLPSPLILSTAVSAADIWTFSTTNLTTANTTGNQVKKLLTTAKFLGLK